MRIGLFGGSFDPVHLAHLIIAQEARWQLALDRVLLTPTARPPHKPGRRLTPIADRVRMVELAVDAVPGLELCDHEAGERVAYTVDTLRELRRRFGESAGLFLILGADSLLDLDAWRSPDEICRLATLAIYHRPGAAVTDSRFPHVVIRGPLLEISASEIRERMGDGRPVRFWIPDAVRRYAEEKSLYGAGSGTC